MIRYRIYRISLFLSCSFLLAGGLMKILHLPGAEAVIWAGYAISLPYIVIGIVDVIRSPEWDFVTKLALCLCFLFLPFVAGFIYHSEIKPGKAKT